MKSARYTITMKTKILAYANKGYYRSYIIEEDKEKYLHLKPEEIIAENCIVHGASMGGRKAVVKEILQSSTKLPIPVFPRLGIFFLPTASVKNKDCVWIAYHHIQHYETYDKGTYIHFYDGTGYFVKTSRTTFDNQYKRTSQVIVHYNRNRLFGYKDEDFDF